MNKCPISYLDCGAEKYAPEGLRQLHRNLVHLEDLPYSAQEQRMEASGRMQRMSIQGVQPKLSAILNLSKAAFEFTDKGGHYIIKPQSDVWRCLPENEDLTMRMAALSGIETPFHGLIWSKDGSLSYFIKRFDRVGKVDKLAVEDFSQLVGQGRDTKYDYTTEKLIRIIDTHCTFPVIEKSKFFRLLLFCFLTGNEDMHLKNFSLITRNGKVEFSPAYDLLNSTIAMGKAEDELALMLAGKRKELRRRELINYFAFEKLALSETEVHDILIRFETFVPHWMDLIKRSFLPADLQENYIKLLKSRFNRLDLRWNEEPR